MSDYQLPRDLTPPADTPFDELAAPDPNSEDILYTDIGSSNVKDR
jgi:hypothetical protein